MDKLHFCGGLPRTCSTILMNILQQNPRVFTSGTCALPDTIERLLNDSRKYNVFKAMDFNQADSALNGFIAEGTRGWFESLTDKPVVVSKNRNWVHVYHLFPKSKFICLIRDLRDIAESYEKLNNKTLTLHHSFPSQRAFYPMLTEGEKFTLLFNETRVNAYVDVHIRRLAELQTKQKDKVLLVKTEDFLKDPTSTINNIYDFLEEEHFTHDFENIEQQKLYEHDNVYEDEVVDHKTESSFKYYSPPNRTISDEYSKAIINKFRWYYAKFYPEVFR